MVSFSELLGNKNPTVKDYKRPEDKITSLFLSEAHVAQSGGPSVFHKSPPKRGLVGADVGKSKQMKFCHLFLLIGWWEGSACSVWFGSLQIPTWMMVSCTA